MSVQNQKNLIKSLVSLISVASAGIALNSPALAFINSSGLNKSFNNGSLQTDSTGKSKQLLAQNTPYQGQPSPGGAAPTNGGTTTTPVTTPGVNNGTTTPGTNGGTTSTPGSTGGTTNGGNDSGAGQSTNGANNRRNGQPTNRSTSGSGTNSSQRSAYTQYMKAGYAATQQKNYQTALTDFKKALSLRPGDRYATQAIQNVQGYIQRGSR